MIIVRGSGSRGEVVLVASLCPIDKAGVMKILVVFGFLVTNAQDLES
jgi:hypothetical protein